MLRLAVILFLLAGCTAQQSRHVVTSEMLDAPERQEVEGRVLDDFTDAERWTPYHVQGGINPLTHEAADGVLRVTSDSSAGLVWNQIGFNPLQEPLLKWRWRVSQTFDTSSPLSPEFDNFPARLLVGFDSGWDGAGPAARTWRRRVEEHTGVTPPARAICYTFGGALGSREAVDAAFGEGRIVVINLRRPNVEPLRWFTEVRDVLADYRAVFREDPPPVTALALGSDSHRVEKHVYAEFSGLQVYGPEAYTQFRRALEFPPTRTAPPLVLLIYGVCAGIAALSLATWFWFRLGDKAKRDA
jgi:hypothetical protein